MTDRTLFGPAHLAWLLGIAIAAAWVPSLCRRNVIPHRVLRAVLACLLVGCELQRYIHDGITWPHGLPLQPCSLTAWVAVAACITLAPLAVEYVYFLGVAGAAMAVITPDMGAQWPPRFFLTHGALIVTACVLVFGNLGPWRRWAVWRAWALFLANATGIGIFDLVFTTNYWYLRQKPAVASVFDWMGPWPIYPGTIALFGLGLFWLLWLPWRSHARRYSPLSAPQPAISPNPSPGSWIYSPRRTSRGF